MQNPIKFKLRIFGRSLQGYDPGFIQIILFLVSVRVLEVTMEAQELIHGIRRDTGMLLDVKMLKIEHFILS